MPPVGSSGTPTPLGTLITGHSYTAAYRYQLVIGKVGGWAIPYPLTIPQAVAGLGSVVLTMFTVSWWYPLTGVSGVLLVVGLPVIGIRLISRIRPEGRSVADWIHGWAHAQYRGMTGGVVLNLNPTVAHPGTPHADPVGVLPQPTAARQMRPDQIPESVQKPEPAQKPSSSHKPGSSHKPISSHKYRPARQHRTVWQIAVAWWRRSARTPHPDSAHSLVLQRESGQLKPSQQRTSVQHSRSARQPGTVRTWLSTFWSKDGFTHQRPAPSEPPVPIFDPWMPEPTRGGVSR